LLPAIERAESVIYTQKFTGAAANLLNANLVARELGLADKTELQGKDGGALLVEDITPRHPGEDHLKDMMDRYFGAPVARPAITSPAKPKKAP
jgi:hypothetical protein